MGRCISVASAPSAAVAPESAAEGEKEADQSQISGSELARVLCDFALSRGPIRTGSGALVSICMRQRLLRGARVASAFATRLFARAQYKEAQN